MGSKEIAHSKEFILNAVKGSVHYDGGGEKLKVRPCGPKQKILNRKAEDFRELLGEI